MFLIVKQLLSSATSLDLRWMCVITKERHYKFLEKSLQIYLELVFSDSSPGPPCSPCSSRSCPRSQMGKRSPAAPWGSFWTSFLGNPFHLSLPLVHSSTPSLPSLGCTWPPCSVYPLGLGACPPLSFLFFFFLCQVEGKKEITENAEHRIVWTVWGFSFKTAPFSRAESAI